MRKHLQFHILAVAHVLLLSSWIQLSLAHSSGLSSIGNTQAPRGFCVRIGRAIKRESRCFKHLLLDEQLSDVVTNRQTTANGDDDENDDDDNNSGANNNKRGREELVYVRLETLGAQLANLSTRVVNERVLESLLSELSATQIGAQIGGFTLASTVSNNHNDNDVDDHDDDDEQFRARACQVAIEKFLCRLVYPTCHFRHTDSSALVRPPCREDCLLMRDSICSNLKWSQVALELQRAFNSTLNSKLGLHAIDLIVDGNVEAELHNNSSNHFYWPHERAIDKCESLPPLRATEVTRRRRRRHSWPVCSDARLRQAGGKEQSSRDCYTKRGVNYLGTLNVTRSGRKCQSWASQEPHKHKLSKLLFDNMHEAHNYCRNPGGLELMPWCYTQDLETRWEFCAPKVC